MLENLCSHQSLVIDLFPIGINGKSLVPPGSGHQSLLITLYSLCPFVRLLRVCQSSQLLLSPSQGHPRNFHLLSCANLERLPQASFVSKCGMWYCCISDFISAVETYILISWDPQPSGVFSIPLTLEWPELEGRTSCQGPTPAFHSITRLFLPSHPGLGIVNSSHVGNAELHYLPYFYFYCFGINFIT